MNRKQRKARLKKLNILRKNARAGFKKKEKMIDLLLPPKKWSYIGVGGSGYTRAALRKMIESGEAGTITSRLT